jgi:hypothetical protein
LSNPLGQRSPALGAVRFRQSVEERVFALKKQDDRHAEPAFQLGRKPGEQSVGETNEIWLFG